MPIGVTALLAGAGLILFKVQPAQAAWAPFASPAVMFVLMIIMFGVVLNEVGLILPAICTVCVMLYWPLIGFVQ